jgi:hypothetical protein
MRRLVRHADETGRTIAIATTSRALAARARQVGLPVARKPHQVRWEAGGHRVVRLGSASFVVPAIGRFVQVVVIAAVAGLALALALTLAPSGTVVAYPPSETLAETVTVTAVRDLDAPDLDALRLPAVSVSATRSYTLAIPATGTVNVGIGYARAGVTITNETDADVVVVAGTILLGGPDLLAFALEASVIVPRNGSASGTVVAHQPGERYNLPAGAITGWFEERYRFLKVTNPEPASGGTSEPRPSPSVEDFIAIRLLAANLAVDDAVREDLAAARPHDAIFLRTATMAATVGTPRPPIGTPSTVVMLDVTVEMSALAITAATLEAVARQVLLPADAEGDIIPGTIRATETDAVRYDPEADEFTTSLRLVAEFARGVTAAGVEDAVRGRSPEDARSILRERYAIEDAEVRVVPGWAPFLPRFGFRIDVTLATRPETPAAATVAPNDE